MENIPRCFFKYKIKEVGLMMPDGAISAPVEENISLGDMLEKKIPFEEPKTKEEFARVCFLAGKLLGEAECYKEYVDRRYEIEEEDFETFYRRYKN